MFIHNEQAKVEVESPTELLQRYIKEHEDKIALASSLSIEDQMLTDIIVKINPAVKIFTIDTGRLHEETYKVIDQTNQKYNINIEVYFPDKDKVEKLITNKGNFSFYESVENRKECCAIRKIEPLKRALSGLDIWITGLRREQSVTRTNLKTAEFDDGNRMIKLSPLLDWSESQVWDYIHEHNVPYNSLYKKGFTSIGCAPCTRAIKEGDDIRSGRWWWENPDTKECGLHSN